MGSASGANHTRRYRLWRLVIYLTVGSVFVIAIFHRVAPSVVADCIMESFKITGTAFGSFAAIYFYIYALMQVPSGLLADRVGPRLSITAGSSIGGIGSIILGFSDSLLLAYFSRFLIGFGCSLIFCSFAKLIADWFRPSEYGTFAGGTTVAGGIGGILSTFPFALLVSEVGWRSSFVLIGAINLVLAAVCWPVIKNKPEDMGLPPVGETECRYKESRKTEGGNIPGCTVGSGSMLRSVVQNRYTWPAFFAMFGVYGPVWAFSGSISIPYLMQVYGLSRNSAANILFFLTLGFSISGLAVGFLSDLVRRRKLPYVVMSALCLGAWIVLLIRSGRFSAVWVGIVLFFLGFFGGGSTLTWACSKEVNHPHLAGIATGVANTGGFAGVALFQPLLGYFLDLRWDGVMEQGVPLYSSECYELAITGCLIATAVGLLSTFFLIETGARNIHYEVYPLKQY